MCEGQTTHNWLLIELELLVNVNEGQHWLSYHLFLDIDIEKFLMIILFLQNGIEALSKCPMCIQIVVVIKGKGLA